MKTIMDTLPTVAVLLVARILLCVHMNLAGIVKEKICEHPLESVSEDGGKIQTGKSPYSFTTTQTKYIPGEVTKGRCCLECLRLSLAI